MLACSAAAREGDAKGGCVLAWAESLRLCGGSEGLPIQIGETKKVCSYYLQTLLVENQEYRTVVCQIKIYISWHTGNLGCCELEPVTSSFVLHFNEKCHESSV